MCKLNELSIQSKSQIQNPKYIGKTGTRADTKILQATRKRVWFKLLRKYINSENGQFAANVAIFVISDLIKREKQSHKIRRSLIYIHDTFKIIIM